MLSADNTILTTIEVCARLRISRATFFREASRGNPAFPPKVQMSAHRCGYLSSDVDAYILAQQNPDVWDKRRVGKAA